MYFKTGYAVFEEEATLKRQAKKIKP